MTATDIPTVVSGDQKPVEGYAAAAGPPGPGNTKVGTRPSGPRCSSNRPTAAPTMTDAPHVDMSNGTATAQTQPTTPRPPTTLTATRRPDPREASQRTATPGETRTPKPKVVRKPFKPRKPDTAQHAPGTVTCYDSLPKYGNANASRLRRHRPRSDHPGRLCGRAVLAAA